MKISIRKTELRVLEINTRLPFKYGIATMTRVPHLFLKLELDISGKSSSGIAADFLPPKWFTKIPEKSLDAEVEEMLAVISHAADTAQSLSGQNAFEIWQQLHRAQGRWGAEQKLPPLLAHFGTSMVERALIEALARHSGKSFFQMIRDGSLGLALGEIHPELMRRQADEFLPSQPLPHVVARHTIGLADPLSAQEISERVNDGLPQSLDECIRTYGLRHFKIKIQGKPEADLDRLNAAAKIIQQFAPADFAFSLDANEQFHSLDEFREFWRRALDQAALKPFFRHLLFVEQPLHRDAALAPNVAQSFAGWPDRPPIIIDESDAELDSLPVALHLGYAGTSHKNCKGIFKGVANRCLIAARQHAEKSRKFLMSGEDLCNIGPVALLQDLAAMGALGISSVERNGHHYCRGLSYFPARVQEQILAHHPDLYQKTAAGWPSLKIEQGAIAMGSINHAPFGVGFPIDLGSFSTIDQWRRRTSDDDRPHGRER